jgi:hypothetical protein
VKIKTVFRIIQSDKDKLELRIREKNKRQPSISDFDGKKGEGGCWESK